MRAIADSALVLAALGCATVAAQDPVELTEPRTFDSATEDVEARLQASLAELEALTARLTDEKLPMAARLRELEAEHRGVRDEFQARSGVLTKSTLDLTNLRGENEQRQQDSGYIANLLTDYIRNFEAGLHIAELQRYDTVLEAAKLAQENTNLSESEVFEAQAALVAASLERLHDAIGGTRFDGTAVDPGRLVDEGTFVMIGPVAIFRSADGADVGTAETRLNSSEPTQVAFADPEDAEAAAGLVETGAGSFPLDPTLGNAHKIEATQESLVEHVQKGGPVMVPIFVLAGAALLVALWKWITLSLQRKPSKRQIDGLLEAVSQKDEALVKERAAAIKGPVGRMLSIGAKHLREPRDLIEEVMYESVLTTRLKLNRLLPFIAICAASAPLLGLLGTVTGIINTFKLITVFGSGDVKTLSGGISEALITTKFGLIVAIPSLLMHAFLWRKARGVIGQMETAAVAFANQVSKTPFRRRSAAPVGDAEGAPIAAPDPDLVRAQVNEILSEMLTPLSHETRKSEAG